LKFQGEANVKWIESKSRTHNKNQRENHSVGYSAREEYFKNTFFLEGAKGENVETICLIIIFITYYCSTYTRDGEPFI